MEMVITPDALEDKARELEKRDRDAEAREAGLGEREGRLETREAIARMDAERLDRREEAVSEREERLRKPAKRGGLPEPMPGDILQLSHEYEFEGERVSEIDLSGLRTATARKMIVARKVYGRRHPRETLPALELETEYILILAGLTTERPLEFYESLEYPDVLAVKNFFLVFVG